MKNETFGRVLSILTAVLVALTGIMLIACCAHLYFTGEDQPYSRERAADYLALVLVPGLMTLAAVILGIVYNIINGRHTDTKVKSSSDYILKNVAKRADINSFDPAVREAIIDEQRSRTVIRSVFLALSVACYILCVVCVIFFNDYTVENLNADVIGAFKSALPLGVLGALMSIPSLILTEASAKRELELIKEGKKNAIPKGENPDVAEPASEIKGELNETAMLVIKTVIFVTACVFILLGILNGGMADVLAKAVKICTECIGLG